MTETELKEHRARIALANLHFAAVLLAVKDEKLRGEVRLAAKGIGQAWSDLVDEITAHVNASQQETQSLLAQLRARMQQVNERMAHIDRATGGASR